MDILDEVSAVLANAGFDVDQEINDREAEALRATLAPWIAWMRRPEFAAPDATYDVFIGGPKSGTVEQTSGTAILGILGPDGRDSGWTQIGTVLVPPPDFDGTLPLWVYHMTQREGLGIRGHATLPVCRNCGTEVGDML